MTAAAASVALASMLVACGDSDSDDSGGPYSSDETTSDDGADETMDAVLAVGTVGASTIITDAEGMTVYMFTADTDGTSTCYDECATAWPPLIVEGEVSVGDDLDASLTGTTERDDGTLQATYNNFPLYYFASDAAAGDTTGQGVNEVWYVLGPDGAPITSEL